MSSSSAEIKRALDRWQDRYEAAVRAQAPYIERRALFGVCFDLCAAYRSAVRAELEERTLQHARFEA